MSYLRKIRITRIKLLKPWYSHVEQDYCRLAHFSVYRLERLEEFCRTRSESSWGPHHDSAVESLPFRQTPEACRNLIRWCTVCTGKRKVTSLTMVIQWVAMRNWSRLFRPWY